MDNLVSIRVITPKVAAQIANNQIDEKAVPCLNDGNPIPLTTTLRELKQLVATTLNETIHLPESDKNKSNECNCFLAGDIAKRGVWDMLRPRYNGQKNFAPCEDKFDTEECGLCCRALSQACGTCEIQETDETYCSVVVNAGCRIGDFSYGQKCPQGCSIQVTQREMIPSNARGRRLIVVYGHSALEIFALDRCFGGEQDRATINLSTLKDTIQELLGKSNCDGKTWSIVDGFQNGDKVQFHHSLVISICSNKRHPYSQRNFSNSSANSSSGGMMDVEDDRRGFADPASEVEVGYTSSTDDNLMEIDPPRSVATPQNLKTLDLHTASSVIGTGNLDISVKDLCLHEYAVDGVLTIYAVIRHLGENTASWNKFGKEAIFSFNKSWELPSPDSQTERGYACFLSSLRVFANCFEKSAHRQRAVKDHLLRILANATKFPPAVRAMYTIIDQSDPMEEDCAALIQAIHQLSQHFIPADSTDFDPRRTLEHVRPLFGYLYQQSNIKYKRDYEGAFPYLDLFEWTSLICSVTQEPVMDPIVLPNDGGIMEYGLAHEYANGRLRMTNPICLSIPNGNGNNVLKRVALASDGKFRKFVSFTATSGITEKYNDASDELLAPFEIDLNKLCTQLSTGTFGIISPMDLHSGINSVLTLDERTWLAVFVGYQPCGVPPKNTTLFCPTKGGDTYVDVAMVTQAIARKREENSEEEDFDTFGSAASVNAEPPAEIIMICLDTSQSMNSDADFRDMHKDSDEQGEETVEHEYEAMEQLAPSVAEWSIIETQEYLSNCDYFPDLLRIINLAGALRNRQLTAGDVIDNLVTCCKQMVLSLGSAHSDSETLELRNFINSMGKSAVRNSLVQYMAQHSQSQNHINLVGPRPPQEISTLGATINREFTCPITGCLLRDPVAGNDSKTYDREVIQDWFRMYDVSPLSGLPITSSFRKDHLLKRRIDDWATGRSIIATVPAKRKFDDPELWQLQFHIQEKIVWITISSAATLSDLRDLAFRCVNLKVPTNLSSIRVFHGNAPVVSSNLAVSLTPIKSGDAIKIETIPPLPLQSGDHFNYYSFTRQCLIKLYRSTWNRPDTCFWISTDTDSRIISILIRYWAWSEASILEEATTASKLEAWIPNVNTEDNQQYFWTVDSSDRLAPIIEAYGSPGVVEPDHLFGKSSKFQGNARPRKTLWTLKVLLRDYRSPAEKRISDKKRHSSMTRIQTVKQMFEAFINRTLAYQVKNHIGLITFSTQARVYQPITDVIEDFRNSVAHTTCHGDTALWDALALARENLSAYAEKFPEAKKRIICLSDGEDTKSVHSSGEVCRALRKDNIVVDSFVIGNEDNYNLRSISYLTGGYKFNPKDLDSAMSICELESVLSFLERPTVSEERRSSLADSYDIISRDNYPQRKEHPLNRDTFLALSEAAEVVGRKSVSQEQKKSQWSQKGPGRLLFEMRNTIANIHPYYDVYVSESDMCFWKIVMEGPPNSTYAGGVFLMYLDMESSYPSCAPKARFITPILHPNITKQGRICHSNWTTDTSCVDVINSIWALLLVPDLEDPANMLVTQKFYSEPGSLEAVIKEHMARHARKSRQEYAQELGGR